MLLKLPMNNPCSKFIGKQNIEIKFGNKFHAAWKLHFKPCLTENLEYSLSSTVTSQTNTAKINDPLSASDLFIILTRILLLLLLLVYREPSPCNIILSNNEMKETNLKKKNPNKEGSLQFRFEKRRLSVKLLPLGRAFQMQGI